MPTGYVLDATDQILLTFKSTRILRTENGTLEVNGDLRLNHVKGTVIITPTGVYAGPVYGDPVIHNETCEVAFLFPSVSAAHLSGPLTPAMLQKKEMLEIVGSARVDGEEFPEPLGAINEINWPPVMQSKGCHIRGHYSGVLCTGTSMAATGDDNRHMSASVSPQCTTATGNQATIVLDLKFLHTGSRGSTCLI